MIENIIGILIFILFIYIIYVIQKKRNLIQNNTDDRKKDKKNKRDKKTKKNKKDKHHKKPKKDKQNKQEDIKQEDIKQEKIKSIIKKAEKKLNHVYLTIEVNGKTIGKIIINLFDKIVPKTTNNFRTLCIDKKYVTAPFHRIIKDFMLQSGDFTNYNGTGGYSIYGEKFEDENFKLKHDRPYLLSMANSGSNTNGSQFFITTKKTPHLDGKHVIFGEVIHGFELVDKLNNVKTDSNDKPIDNIVINDCGVI
jgi:peptidylprolyl isomerase